MNFVPDQSTDFTAGTSSADFFTGFLLIFLGIALLAFIITMTVVNRKFFKQHFKTGLILGIICLVLSAPFAIAALLSLDVNQILAAAPQTDGMSLGPGFTRIFSFLMVVIEIIVLLAGVAYTMMTYVVAAAEWQQVMPVPFPVLMKSRHKGWGRIALAAGVGGIAGVISVIAAHFLNVGANQILEKQVETFMNINFLPVPLQFVFLLLFVVQAAIAEEVLFRGALLGFLARLSKNRMIFLLGSIFLVSILWALMHLGNTDSPAFKISQVFILGTIFAEFTRRWSLEASIAAHASLNIVAVVLAFFPLF